MAPSPSCHPRMWARVSGPTGIPGTVQCDKELGAIGTPSPSGPGTGCSGGNEQHGQGEINSGVEGTCLSCGAAEGKHFMEDLSFSAARHFRAEARVSCPPAPPDQAPPTPHCAVSSAALLPMQ